MAIGAIAGAAGSVLEQNKKGGLLDIGNKNLSGWKRGVANMLDLGGGISSMFGLGNKEGETLSIEDMMPAWIKSLGTQSGDILSQGMQGLQLGQGYSGDLTAGMTGAESQGLEALKKILSSSDTGELFGAAKGQLLDTLGGKYVDPSTSPYIQAMMKLSKRNLEENLNTSRREAGSRGQYFHSKAIEEEGDVQSKTMDTLNAIIGQFQQNERQNQLGSVDPAFQMGKYENFELPMAKVGASQTYGSLERVLEQADLDRQYNEWTRSRGEQTGALTGAQSLYKGMYGNIDQWQMPEEEGMASGLMGSLSSIIKLIGSMKGGSANTGNIETSYGSIPRG